MAWGLEARVPFLDHELVELAAQMPPELKLQSGGKHVLKRIARGLVPDQVIDRSKGYFPMPALKYVRGDFLDFMQDILNSQACRERGVYQRGMWKITRRTRALSHADSRQQIVASGTVGVLVAAERGCASLNTDEF